jgi:hypothetical protein
MKNALINHKTEPRESSVRSFVYQQHCVLRGREWKKSDLSLRPATHKKCNAPMIKMLGSLAQIMNLRNLAAV